jgi:hypothetical protein
MSDTELNGDDAIRAHIEKIRGGGEPPQSSPELPAKVDPPQPQQQDKPVVGIPACTPILITIIGDDRGQVSFQANTMNGVKVSNRELFLEASRVCSAAAAKFIADFYMNERMLQEVGAFKRVPVPVPTVHKRV